MRDAFPRIESLETRRLFAGGPALDPTFGVDGRAVQSFVGGRLLGLQPEGKILIASVGPHGGNGLMRLNADGSPDNTFLGGSILDFPITSGYRINPIDGRIAYQLASAEDPDLIDIHVLRADGAIDTSFGGGDGIASVSGINDFDWQGDKLVYNADEDLRRLNSDGSPDSTFGVDGVAAFQGDLRTFDLDSHGRIYLIHDQVSVTGGSTTSNPDYSSIALLTRLTPDGDLDTSYGGGGISSIDSASSHTVAGRTIWLHVEPDGTAYHTMTTGEGPVDGDGRVIISRTLPDGHHVMENYVLNGDNAHSSPLFLPQIFAKDVRVQADGKILLIRPVPDASWEIARLNIDGSIDQAFGTNGVATLDIIGGFSDVAQLPDGKLLFGGKRIGADGAFEVQRIITLDSDIPEEEPTATLNKKGTLIVRGTSSGESASVTLRKRDGRLVARVGDFAASFSPSKVKRIAFFLDAGDDVLTVGAGVLRAVYAEGGDGNDTLTGGIGGDVFLGDLGKDQLLGNDGDDTLLGGGGNDYLLGGAGKDDLFGNGGTDTLSGAGGNDRLFGGPDAADRILGGSGTDSAADDDKDQFESVETLLA